MSDKSEAPRVTDAPDDADSISLRPIFEVLSHYRRRLGLAILSAVALIASVALLVYLLAPTYHVGSLSFHLRFTGAEKGFYPNDTKFSASEIVATPILDAAYRSNGLQKYLDFPSFKDAVFVLESNPELQFLVYVYTGKLSDTRLTTAERAALEAEFTAKRNSIVSADFALNFRRSERTTSIPTTIVDKVLHDVLNEWARVARDQKGALEYDIPVLSKDVFHREGEPGQDPIVAADILRNQINRVLENIDKLAALPGASALRPDNGRSLSEIRLELQQLLRFELLPAMRLTRPTNPQAIRVYMQDQLQQVINAHAEHSERLNALRDPLLSYSVEDGARRAATVPPARESQPLGSPTLMPQLGESFLQQLMQLARQGTDVEYRQRLTDRIITEGLAASTLEQDRRFYESMLTTAKDGAILGPSELSQRLKSIAGRAEKEVTAVTALYHQLSVRNLNASTELFVVTFPYAERTERSIPGSKLVIFGTVALLFALFALVIGAFVHRYYLVTARLDR